MIYCDFISFNRLEENKLNIGLFIFVHREPVFETGFRKITIWSGQVKNSKWILCSQKLDVGMKGFWFTKCLSWNNLVYFTKWFCIRGKILV